jgi:hypothetical protein
MDRQVYKEESLIRLSDLYPELCNRDRKQVSENMHLSAEELMQKANQLADDRYFVEALNFYDLALMKAPNSPEIWYNVGKTFSDMERDSDAIRCYEKTIELCPSFVSAWNNKGVSYAKSEQIEKAIACFKKALEIDPSHPSAEEGLRLCESIMAWTIFRGKNHSELPKNMTPGQYLELLRYHMRKLSVILTQDQRGKYREELFQDQEFISFLKGVGYDDKMLRNRKLPEDFVKHQFNLLVEDMPPEQKELFSNDSVFAIGELPIESINAELTRAPNGGWLILVRTGLMVFIYKLARIICTRFVAVDSQGKEAYNEKVPEFSVTCSVARELFVNYARGYPICSNFPIAPSQRWMANMLATKAEQFVFGHELGHLALGHLNRDTTKAWQTADGFEVKYIPKSWEEEFEADACGLNMLLHLSESDDERLVAYAGIELFLQMCAVFEEMKEFSGSLTHPPSRERLARLRAHLKKICVEQASYDAIMHRPLALEQLFKAIRGELLNRTSLL